LARRSSPSHRRANSPATPGCSLSASSTNASGSPQANACALNDPRERDLTEHTFLEIARSRVNGNLAGYEGQNDHDTLRADPMFQLIADRSPDGSDLVRPRRFIAKPSPAPASPVETAHAASLPGKQLLPARQRHFRLRRQRDPLGEDHPCTWRTLLIKVASEVVVRTRRIVVRLSSSWPHLEWYRRVCERLSGPLLTPVPHPFG
jgi:hypothetical protein